MLFSIFQQLYFYTIPAIQFKASPQNHLVKVDGDRIMAPFAFSVMNRKEKCQRIFFFGFYITQ